VCRGRSSTVSFKMTLFQFFFLRKGNEFGNNPKIGYDSCLPLYNAYGARTLHSKCCK
jgi:hypothetical protein